MEGDGDYYLRRLETIAIDFMNVIMEMKNDKFKEAQIFSNVRREEKIIYFPYFTKNGNIFPSEESDEPEEQEERKNEDNEVFFNFTEKEMKKMPKTFRNEFKTGKIKARIRKCKNKYYEIRVQLDKIRITASSVNLETAKERFIEKLNEYENAKQSTKTRKDVLLGDYLIKWLNTVKKPYIKESTFKEYQKTVNLDLIPKFGTRKMTDVTTLEIQEYVNEYTAAGKNRTAKKLYQMLSALFTFAVADDLIQKAPTEKVHIGAYEQEHGTALTRQEEKRLIEDLFDQPKSRYRQAFAFILYTGLRRSELASAQLNGEWITVITAKQRKGHKEKARRIPVSPMLKKLLPMIDLNLIRQTNPNKLTCAFSDLYPNHHLHELRHTFITRCQECGIPREIVSVWAGHSTDKSITTTVYTHLEQFEARQIAEISKFIYDFD